MADFLAGLGEISQQKLADEQLRQLESLHGQSAKGSIDRLHIAQRLAETRWGYSRHDEAIDLLQAALAEYEQACGGVLPVNANDALDTMVDFLKDRGHFARGERVLFDQLGRPVHQQHTYWLRERLYRLYRDALESNGDVTLGTKKVLYRALQHKLHDELKTADHNHRRTLVSRICSVYRVAHKKKFDGVADDLRAFAFQRVPEVLGRQTNNYESIVEQVADSLHAVAGPRDGLEFLIERIEQEPSWFRYIGEDGWKHHAYDLGVWRTEVKDLGDLEDRLLAIVVAELRWDLESRQARNPRIYRQHGHLWTEKIDVFVKTAMEVYARRKKSGAAVKYIADYFWDGLHDHGRGIEILLAAHKQKLLDEDGQSTLVHYLHKQGRYGESIAILEPLVQRRPGNMQYRVRLMRAYFHTSKQKELLALRKQTDEYFHQNGRWTEGHMAALAGGCLDTHLYEQSAAYSKEVVSLRKRNQSGRGTGDETLSNYCRSMALAYAGLKNTALAVDAACEAIVCWGPRHEKRQDALDRLKEVLGDSPDLDAYVAEFDRQCQESKKEKPIVRKALGEAYFKKASTARQSPSLERPAKCNPTTSRRTTSLSIATTSRKTRKGPCSRCSTRCNCCDATSIGTRTSRSGSRSSGVWRRPNGLTPRSSRCFPANRKATPCWRRSAKGKTGGKRPSYTGGKSPEFATWSPPDCKVWPPP